MLETILTLLDTKNHPFYEKIIFFNNHNPYFAQVSTHAWGYHVVTVIAVRMCVACMLAPMSASPPDCGGRRQGPALGLPRAL